LTTQSLAQSWCWLLGQDPIASGGRRVIFLSGDSAPAKQANIDLFNAAGFNPIDLGDLVSGGRMQQLGDHFPGTTSSRARPDVSAQTIRRMRT
jgi:predicted dinucleotide-binding enzyme